MLVNNVQGPKGGNQHKDVNNLIDITFLIFENISNVLTSIQSLKIGADHAYRIL